MVRGEDLGEVVSKVFRGSGCLRVWQASVLLLGRPN